MSDAKAERLELMRKLSDKGTGELIEEICDLKKRLAIEAKHRKDLLDWVRRLTDENGELRARLAFASEGQPGDLLATMVAPKVRFKRLGSCSICRKGNVEKLSWAKLQNQADQAINSALASLSHKS